NLLYRMASSLRGLRVLLRSRAAGSPADWKSAIQQVGNLRYSTSGPLNTYAHAQAGRSIMNGLTVDNTKWHLMRDDQERQVFQSILRLGGLDSRFLSFARKRVFGTSRSW